MTRQPFNPALAKGPPKPERASDGPLTVSQLTDLVKRAIGAHLPATVHVLGQVSNFKRHTSGHLYWTLKDEASELACVMWRSDAERLKFNPTDGLEVIATGGVDVFERAGRYQLYVRRLEPRGVGALELAFRQLCERLEREGLFDPLRKKRPPKFPRRIAVVTSPTGAAVRDVLTTLRRRFPCVSILVCPVRVQGEGAAAEIAGVLASLNQHAALLGGIDVILLARGGGSLEDLWAFNEEAVARAIFASAIPIITGVGHETDVTIADLAADLRAATPTAAAELAVPVLTDVLSLIAAQAGALHRFARHRYDLAHKTLEALQQRPWLRDPVDILRRREQGVDELAERLRRRVAGEVTARARALRAVEPLVQRIHPRTVLARASARLSEARERGQWVVLRKLAAARTALQRHALEWASRTPARRLAVECGKLLNLESRGRGALAYRLERGVTRLSALAAMLEATGHRATLARGFSITRRKRDRSILTDVALLAAGERLVTETATGEVESRVVDSRQMELFD